MHAFALPFDPEWKERKYSIHPWARFAFLPAEDLLAELERHAAEELAQAQELVAEAGKGKSPNAGHVEGDNRESRL